MREGGLLVRRGRRAPARVDGGGEGTMSDPSGKVTETLVPAGGGPVMFCEKPTDGSECQGGRRCLYCWIYRQQGAAVTKTEKA